MRVRELLSLLAIVAMLATVVMAQQSPERVSDARDSGCWECHATGGGNLGPPMRLLYALVSDSDLPETGRPGDIEVTVHNTWVAELRDITARLDLEQAPSYGFVVDMDPVSESQHWTLPAATLTDGATVTGTVAVPAGITDLQITASPDGDSTFGAPDISLHIWPTNSDPNGQAPIRVDQQSAGGSERFKAQGGQHLATLGAGSWTVSISHPSVLEQGLPGLDSHPVTVRLQAWSNVTDERIRYVAADGVLDGQNPSSPQEADFRWRILAESSPAIGETVTVTVDATAYYRHPPTISQVNEWPFSRSFSMVVEPPPVASPEPTAAPDNSTHQPGGSLPPGLQDRAGGPGPGTTIVDPAAGALDWVRIGEVIGYLAAFLIVFSEVTGGLFGRWNRRIMNLCFRSARHRIAFHNFTSYFLIAFSAIHTAVFLLETTYSWKIGLLLGGLALLCMLGLGVTGALQVPMIRVIGYGGWRAFHLTLGIATLFLVVAHILLDGANFRDIQEAVGWDDPLVRWLDPMF